MANSFSPLLGLVKQVPGENPDGLWGSTLNSGFMELVDEAIAGRSDIDVSSGSVTLSSDIGVANEARAMILVIGGTPGVARNVIVPSTQKLYIASNESDDVVTVKTTIGAGVTIAVGDMVLLAVDASLDDVIQIGSSGTSIDPAPAFSLPTQPGVIVGSTGGLRFPSVTVSSQGSLTAILNPFSVGSGGVTVNDTIFRWVKTDIPGGSADGSTYSPAPKVDTDFLHFVVENGTVHECFTRYFADGLSIECFKCDGAAWIATSTRVIASSATQYNIYSTV